MSTIRLSLLLSTAMAPGVAPIEIPRDELIREMLVLSGQTAATPEDFDTARMAADSFVGVRLGLFHLHTPVDSIQRLGGPGEYPVAEEFQDIAVALLDLQATWLEWLEPAAGSQKADFKRIQILRKWVLSWEPRDLARKGTEGGFDVMAALEPKDSIQKAAQDLHASMIRGDALGMGRLPPEAGLQAIPGEDIAGLGLEEPLLLASTRRDFLRMISFAGWLLPDVSAFQDPGVRKWTNFYFNRYKVLATQYSKPFAREEEVFAGLAMEHRLLPQISQLAALSLVDNYFGDRIPPAFAGAMAINLVIDVYGSCDTRVDGDLSERRTEAREMFVPGGLSEGGVLPKVSADNHFREGHGADHFIRALAISQREGLEKSRRGFPEKVSHFQLLDVELVEEATIHGPHLGLASDGRKGVDDPFLGDLLEFQRSFRSAFLHWLRTEAAGPSRSSAKKLGTLLISLAASEPNEFDSIVEQVYGAPLSAATLDRRAVSSVLEGRFLTWLSKVKYTD